MASGPIIDSENGSKLQFGLRTMLWAVAILAVLFAVMSTLGAAGSAAFLLVLAVIGLHVAGNALGTTLRDNAPTEAVELAGRQPRRPTPERITAALPPSRLYHRTSLGWMIWVTTVLGSGLGGWFGATELAPWFGPTTPGLVVGAGSFAVLGAFFGFLSGSFLKMALTAWWQAIHVVDARHPADADRKSPLHPLDQP